MENGEIKMQLVESESSSIWAHKFIKLRENLETIKFESLSGIINKTPDGEIMVSCNLILDTHIFLMKLCLQFWPFSPLTVIIFENE